MAITTDHAGLEVLEAIVRAPEAWVQADPIERQRPGLIPALVCEGLLELWDRPDYLAVTLTPLAAERLGVQIVEHWVLETIDTGADQRPPCHHVERVAEEIPGWVPAEVEPGPIVLPRRAREVPLPYPERLRAPSLPPEELVDDYTGEPVKLFGRTVVRARRKGWTEAAQAN